MLTRHLVKRRGASLTNDPAPGTGAPAARGRTKALARERRLHQHRLQWCVCSDGIGGTPARRSVTTEPASGSCFGIGGASLRRSVTTAPAAGRLLRHWLRWRLDP